MKSDFSTAVARARRAPWLAAGTRTASAGRRAGIALAATDDGNPKPSPVARSGDRPSGQETRAPRPVSRLVRSKLPVFHILAPGRGDIGAGRARIPRGSSLSPLVRRALRS